MFVTIRLSEELNGNRNNSEIERSLRLKMAETKVKFPCKPKINMNVHVHSFYDCYNLNDDEKDLWKKKFQNGRYLEIVSRVIFKDHLEIWLPDYLYPTALVDALITIDYFVKTKS